MPAWVLPAAIAAGSALVGAGGQAKANKENRKEAARNRAFQEKMSSTAYQRSTADMKKAGMNPALMYGSAGAASTPAGSAATAQKSLTEMAGPGLSSAMQTKRLTADLGMIEAQTRKVDAEGRGAAAAATLQEARLAAYGVEVGPGGMLSFSNKLPGDATQLPWMTREIRAKVGMDEARGRQSGLTGDIMSPLADLSGSMGQLLPILALISQLMPMGRAAGVAGAAGRAGGRFWKKPTLKRVFDPKKPWLGGVKR